jgi:hypothetical protein
MQKLVLSTERCLRKYSTYFMFYIHIHAVAEVSSVGSMDRG